MGGVILILLGIKILLEHLGIINFWVQFGDGGKIVPRPIVYEMWEQFGDCGKIVPSSIILKKHWKIILYSIQ